MRIRVAACGVCRTDLHVVDGDLPWPGHAVVPGHEIVGTRRRAGRRRARAWRVGQRVGVPWLGWTCGALRHCRAGRENLCAAGALHRLAARRRLCRTACWPTRATVFALPAGYSDAQAAPLLCAGLIGWRAYAAWPATQAQRIGLYGFGAAAHLIAQVAVHQGREVLRLHAARRHRGAGAGARAGRRLGRRLGPAAPQPLDAALLFAPVGALVPLALQAVRPGGTVVCAGIHMSDIPSFPYRWLWGERRIVSVANLTRQRRRRTSCAWPPSCRCRCSVHRYALAQANQALDDLRAGRFAGAAVLRCAGAAQPP